MLQTKISESNPRNFAAALIAKERRVEEKLFISCKFLLSTSNLLERLFNVAGYTFTDFRQKLSPVNIEEQLFLKVN